MARTDPDGARTGNLLADLPADLPEELLTPIVTSGPVRVERIVSRGHASPEAFWYDQEEHEWVLVVQGHARLEIEDRGEVSLGAGDHIFLPAHLRHRVAWTDPDRDTVWLAVFISPTAP